MCRTERDQTSCQGMGVFRVELIQGLEFEQRNKYAF
jgi:hypothetical protein